MCENVHITESATRIYELILAHISMGKWWKANNATVISWCDTYLGLCLPPATPVITRIIASSVLPPYETYNP